MRYRAAALVLAALVAACGGSDKAIVGPSTAARVRLVHAAPTAPSLDMLVDGNLVLSNAGYPSASDYLDVASGQRNFRLRGHGTSTDVLDATPTFAGGTDYSFVVVGNPVASAPILLLDNNSAPQPGPAALRIMIAAPSAGNVDVYIVEPDGALDDVIPAVANATFPVVSAYLPEPTGRLQVVLTTAGTKDIILRSGAVRLNAGSVRTVLALDAPGGGTPLTSAVLTDRE